MTNNTIHRRDEHNTTVTNILQKLIKEWQSENCRLRK